MATFEEWALLELFGHTRIAGLVTEAEIGGGKFIRVDVPEVDGVQPLTKIVGPSAVYSITPVTKETALMLAKQIKAAPISQWDARELVKDAQDAKRLPVPTDDDYDEELPI